MSYSGLRNHTRNLNMRTIIRPSREELSGLWSLKQGNLGKGIKSCQQSEQ